MSSWEDTTLWAKLSGARDIVLVTSRLVLSEAETVLKSGGSAPLAFTLHDESHSFRVAQRIAELCPENALTELEISLALLAAYLHDIGMSPSGTVSAAHYKYIVTGDAKGLSAADREDFQRWLDEHWGGQQPPFEHKVGHTGADMPEEILSYYTRYRHNDWSERWIRDNVAKFGLGLYPNWLDDLVSLCRSHHEHLQDLKGARFDAKIVGSEGTVVNLRYLAALLRLADVTEFDPERTPEVILNHRNIPASSKIYWQKDHQISFRIDKAGRSMLLTARTPNAAIHRAVLETLDAVNIELSTCSVLAQTGAFKLGAVPEGERERYVWRWPTQLSHDIREKDSSFVYIDGAFRPNVARTLELLSGVALYGHPLAALRELMQNAVDAVRQQIAYERLLGGEPASSEEHSRLQQSHVIRLTIESDQTGLWLRCSDDGVGMTKNIIERHLLVSGSKPPVQTITLERSASDAGFSVGRTGQFGIGVLSYFMIADRIEISTRRSAEAGDADGQGWWFGTDGVGQFGELAPLSRGSRGTEVRLRLRLDRFGTDVDSVFLQIKRYLQNSVLSIPCRFELYDETGANKFSLGAGWTSDPDLRRKFLLSTFSYYRENSDFVSDEVLEGRRRRAEKFSHAMDLAATRLRWFGPQEFAIPEMAGHGRVFIPYFHLDRGECLGLLKDDRDEVTLIYGNRELGMPSGRTRLAWRGFTSNSGSEPRRNYGMAEIDVSEGLSIAVNRKELSGDFQFVDRNLAENSESILLKFLEENRNSKYALLNSAIARQIFECDLDLPNPKRLFFKYKLDDKEYWSDIKFPAHYVIESKYGDSRPGRVTTADGSVLPVISDIRYDSYEWLSVPTVVGGGRVILQRTAPYKRAPVIIWDRRVDFKFGKFGSKFPAALNEVMLLCHPYFDIPNSNSPSIKKFGFGGRLLLGDDWEKIYERREVADVREVAKFVIRNLRRGYAFWSALRDRNPEALAYFAGSLALPNSRPITVIFYGWGVRESGILQITSDSVAFVEDGYLSGRIIELPLGGALELAHE